jgi:hypothetical protein
MGKTNRYGVVKLNIRPWWEMSKGHSQHLSGSGQHDSRPKRQRTRGSANRRSIEDQ